HPLQQCLALVIVPGRSGRSVQCGRQSRTVGEVHGGTGTGLQHAQGLEQGGIEGFLEDPAHLVMGLPTGEVAPLRSAQVQFGARGAQPLLGVGEPVVPGGDLGLHLRAHVLAGRLYGAYRCRLGGIGLVQEQVEGFDHRGLAHFVLPLQDHHTGAGEGHFPVGDTAEMVQVQAVDPHRCRPPASRYSSVSAPRAWSRSGSSVAAREASWVTASATKPPMSRSTRSSSPTCTATSLCRCHTCSEANVSRCWSKTASIRAWAARVSVPRSLRRSTVRGLSTSSVRLRSMRSTSSAESNVKLRSRKVQVPTWCGVHRACPPASSTTRTLPGSVSTKSVTSGGPE